MFKSRWRGGGAKAKAVFKLQFHATQVPELGWEAMMVVVTPQDAGRPTARSEPAEVADGACRWAAPILEATKLAAGKDKIYQFLVYETGSSKAALLGEATVNLAEYADALKPSAVTLPLKGSPGALLHVTIQRVVGGAGGCGDDARWVGWWINLRTHLCHIVVCLSFKDHLAPSQIWPLPLLHCYLSLRD